MSNDGSVLQWIKGDGVYMSSNTYGFRVCGVELPAPELSQVLKTVPYRSGSYDFTYAYDGSAHYEDCEFTVEFKRGASDHVDGKAALNAFRIDLYKVRCTDSDQYVYLPGYGRVYWCSCTKVESEITPSGFATVTATFNCTEPSQFTKGS